MKRRSLTVSRRRAGVPMQEREGGALPAADFAFSNKTNHLDLNKVQILKV